MVVGSQKIQSLINVGDIVLRPVHTERNVRAHLHPATATSLPNLVYCFGVVLLHQVFVTATATNFAVTGESLCDQ